MLSTVDVSAESHPEKLQRKVRKLAGKRGKLKQRTLFQQARTVLDWGNLKYVVVETFKPLIYSVYTLTGMGGVDRGDFFAMLVGWWNSVRNLGLFGMYVQY